MTYKASEILNRALSIADMSNTTFLTYKEKIDYLNQAWKQASQAAINKGCKYFIETVEIYGNGEYDLPEDFYQIESIRTTGGMIVSRHTASTPDCVLSYDIVGDKLKIYGSGSTLQVNYWKVPMFLSFPSEIKDLGLELPEVKSCYGTKIVYFENNELKVYDVSSDETVLLTDIPEGTSFDLVAGKHYVYVKAEMDDVITRMFINYKGRTVTTAETDNIYLDDTGYLKEYESDNYSGFILKSGPYIYGKVEGGVKEYTTNTFIPYTKEIKIFKPITFDSKFGVLINTTMYVEGEEIDTDVNGFEVKDLFKADWNTGYGFLVYNGDTLEVDSFVPDTLLNFPTTLLFDYLSYLLAYMFVLKSGADTTAVSSALNIAEYTFYDSLDNGGTYPRITNVY